VDAVATFDEADGSAALFVVNRSSTETQTVQVDVRDLGVDQVHEALSLWDEDVYAKNTLEDQERVGLRPTPVASLADGVLTLELPPVSWTGVSLG
jgi:alpha-N-arabinofuranosidase